VRTRIWALVALLLAFGSAAHAQEASIIGTAVDETRAVLAGVSVIATDQASGRQLSAMTNARGEYRLLNVPPGTYALQAEIAGFATVILLDIELLVGQNATIPLTMKLAFELLEKCGLPPGVANIVNGGKSVVDMLIDHPDVKAISFVGSTPVARYVYARAGEHGKRAQCQGGAKNHVIVLPDADMKMTTQIIGDSAFGCAGQRCLAVSVAVTIGEAQKTFRDSITEAAASLRVGNGLDEGVQMGPVISPQSKARVESLIATGQKQGAKILLDGRNSRIPKGETGNFVKPTILDGVPATSDLTETEIFGPVLSMVHANDLDEALAFLERSPYGNQASLFTSSGAAARRFRYDAPAGNVGINIGVAAPMAYFPFSGWKDSFFGIMHAQGRDAVEFYTEKKIVVERWAKDHSRKF